MGAPASYFYPYGKEGDIRRVPGLQEDGKPGEYLTDRLTDETIAFIREHRNEPFFAYLSHYAVHTPLQARKGLVSQYKKRIDATVFKGPAYIRMRGTDQKMRQDNATFAAMVHAVDQGVGRIMKELQDLGLTENTIVLFTSDNGGDSSKAKRGGTSTSNVPLKGGKCWIYEGGVRVPFIARWPGVIAAGKVSDRLVAGMDHYPSILELLGLPLRPEQHLDAVSYAPVLRGQPQSPRKPIVHNFPEGIARIGIDAGTSIRHEDFKLIVFKNGARELYNLREDVGEEHDLSRAIPEKVDELESLLDVWRAEMRAHQLK
jgi:arylsulfatase A-like enzyme